MIAISSIVSELNYRLHKFIFHQKGNASWSTWRGVPLLHVKFLTQSRIRRHTRVISLASPSTHIKISDSFNGQLVSAKQFKNIQYLSVCFRNAIICLREVSLLLEFLSSTILAHMFVMSKAWMFQSVNAKTCHPCDYFLESFWSGGALTMRLVPTTVSYP